MKLAVGRSSICTQNDYLYVAIGNRCFAFSHVVSTIRYGTQALLEIFDVQTRHQSPDAIQLCFIATIRVHITKQVHVIAFSQRQLLFGLSRDARTLRVVIKESYASLGKCDFSLQNIRFIEHMNVSN